MFFKEWPMRLRQRYTNNIQVSSKPFLFIISHLEIIAAQTCLINDIIGYVLSMVN